MAFDSVILGAYLHPEASYPKPVDRVPERLKHFVQTLDAASATIIIPTPALSEFLVLAAGDASAYLSELADSAVDRQIVAIAKVHGVDELYTDDGGVRRLAESDGIRVKGVADLPLPPVGPPPPLFSDSDSDAA